LGVAKALCKDILLLKPAGLPVPSRIAGGLRCVELGDLRQPAAQNELSGELFRYFGELRARLEPQVLDSVQSRTTKIVDDLRRLANRPAALVRRQAVWSSGFLSSFAIGRTGGFEDSEMTSSDLLVEERECLHGLARIGCRLVCMISPPTPVGPPPPTPNIILPRVRRLLDLIGSDDPGLDHIDWIVAPFWLKNFMIIGNISCYERCQKGTDRGDAVTLRQADQAAIRSSTAMYEFLFDRLVGLMLRTPPPSDPGERRKILRRETEKGLRKVLGWLEGRTSATDPRGSVL
jgi:hypothetical protein